ncbi:MAG: chemotaxis protein CheB [Flaviaesturariibacter sp.]|nr:chemotaxis protein CheB [Flaviaesturariibacter sp.]
MNPLRLIAHKEDPRMAKRNIVVIGASAGGILALTDLFKSLPADFEAYIFVVLHISPYSPSVLPQILSNAAPFKAKHAKDGDAIEPNLIYVAPPDHHLILEKGKVLVKKGPKENRFRPSIDALFRSAAYTFGSRVIGIVLSGMLDDGTSGLWSIKRLGGIAMIQDPTDAEFPHMPLNVMEYVEVDHMLRVEQMGALLAQLTSEEAPAPIKLADEEFDRLNMEVLIAAQDNAFEMGVLQKGENTNLTCPECSGALVKFTEGKIKRYRCHTGHGFTENALLAGVTKSLEDDLWKVVRGMEEAIILLEAMARQYELEGQDEPASLFYKKALDTHKQSQSLRQYIFKLDPFSEDMRFGKTGE